MATLSRILAWRIPWTVCGVAKSWTPLSMHICINVILLEERSLGKYSSFCSYARKPLRRRFPWPPRLHTHLHAPVVNSEQHLKHSVIIFTYLFSSFLLSAIRVVSSAYLRLLIFLLAVLILACNSSSPAFLVMCSACKLNNQTDNKQPCHMLFIYYLITDILSRTF